MTLESICPSCQRPYSRDEMARKRHMLIIQLREEGYLLKEIVVRVGMKDHTSVWHHTSGRCKCLRDTT